MISQFSSDYSVFNWFISFNWYGLKKFIFRYANRAKNIINKPTVNEDPNVKLIRELRAEIERLKTNLGPVDLDTRKTLAVKEAQERHLTEEWTEKWKEAAKILDEHNALALKQTGKKK